MNSENGDWKKVAFEGSPEEAGSEDMTEDTGVEKVDEQVIDDGFMVDVPDIVMPEEGEVRSEVVEDECDGAFRFAFVGTGQGGSRMAEAFWKLGYRRVCCVNTTGQDLSSIDIPEANKLVMDVGEGGAGKNPAKGENAAKTYYEDVYDLMRRSFGKQFDRIIVCVGAGGGTGGGSASVIVDIAHDIAKSFKIEVEGGAPAVGVLVSMPKESEGAKVNANAHGLLAELFGRVGTESGKMGSRQISPLMVLDNDKIENIYPSLPVSKFWGVANQSVSSLLHLFNSIATKDSEYSTFDKADFADILASGVVTFGVCQIKKWDELTDISHAIRDNLKNNVLVGGFDMSKAKAAGCVFIASPDVLETIPQGHLEHGFEMLSRMMRTGGVLHRGIYKGSKKGLMVYSVIGELGVPEGRMAEMKKIGRL